MVSSYDDLDRMGQRSEPVDGDAQAGNVFVAAEIAGVEQHVSVGDTDDPRVGVGDADKAGPT